jgi:hypothetical protein
MCDRASPAVGDSDLGGRGFTGSVPADWSPASGAHRCPILVVLGAGVGAAPGVMQGITLGGDQGTLSFAAEGGAAGESDQKAPPPGPGRPPPMKTYGALVAAENRALPLAFSTRILRLADAAGGQAGEVWLVSGCYLAAAGDAPRRTPRNPARSHHLVPPVVIVMMVAVTAWIRQRPSPWHAAARPPRPPPARSRPDPTG